MLQTYSAPDSISAIQDLLVLDLRHHSVGTRSGGLCERRRLSAYFFGALHGGRILHSIRQHSLWYVQYFICIQPLLNLCTDFVILLIALHTVLTIFKTRTLTDESGLYPHRFAAYAGWILYPSLLSSLPFIHGKLAYVSQTAYCAQPTRPFWYRLALGWVPRYIILIFILSVYVAVYIYVLYKFNDEAFHSTKRTGSVDTDLLTDTDLTTVTTGLDGSSAPNPTGPNASLHFRHREIQKQLRFMFVYPLVYLLMWLIPFVNHCYGYTKTTVPFAVNSLAITSFTLQCAADCLIFILREKPWQHWKGTSKDPRGRLPCWGTENRTSDIQLPVVVEINPGGYQGRRSRNWWDVESAAIGDDGVLEGRTAKDMSES